MIVDNQNVWMNKVLTTGFKFMVIILKLPTMQNQKSMRGWSKVSFGILMFSNLGAGISLKLRNNLVILEH